MLSKLRPSLLILVLGLVFFWPLVLYPTQTLYSDHSDLLAEHIPARRFLVRSYHETGELPLWNPYHFGGSPFVHDIQVAMFYPPHLVLLALPEERVGPALSWLIVLHLLIAGWGMYAYARHRGLAEMPSLVAAVGFMFGGRWLLHLLGGGHYILVGLAWLPFVLLGLERAIRRNSPAWALVAGLVFALMILGTQPQWTFYAGLFTALWTLGVALEEAGYLTADKSHSRGRILPLLARWIGYGVLTVIVAVSLAAIQLLPTLEAAGQSSRAGGVGQEAIVEGGVRVLLFLVGPALSTEPANLMWEDRGGLALLWLGAAVLAPVLRRGPVRYQAGVCLALFAFAMGGAILFQPLPGFNLFRQPARMAVVAGFPVAYLVGVTTQSLFPLSRLTEEQHRGCLRWLVRIGVAVLLLSGGFALRLVLQGDPVRLHPYWLVAPVVFGLALWLVARSGASPRQAGLLWAGLLLVDLWALTLPLVAVRPEEEIYALPAVVSDVTQGTREERGRVLDFDRVVEGKSAGTPLGWGTPLALIAPVEAVRGYSPLDVLRYREYLQFIAGQDQPLGALASNFTYPIILWSASQPPVANRNLLDLLGVRYVLAPDGQPPEGPGWHKGTRQEKVVVYDFNLGGMQNIGRYTVFENRQALPRAFVVGRAEPLPDRDRVLEKLKRTNFRETVLLEGLDAMDENPGTLSKRTVRIREYEPNRVRVEVEGDAGGYLVLADVWYPGWVATVDGEPSRVYRADHVFRAVKLPPGRHEVVFRFEPESYRKGRLVTLVALSVSLLLLPVLFLIGRRRP
jgi:Bacterial membrane protein YfhO